MRLALLQVDHDRGAQVRAEAVFLDVQDDAGGDVAGWIARGPADRGEHGLGQILEPPERGLLVVVEHHEAFAIREPGQAARELDDRGFIDVELSEARCVWSSLASGPWAAAWR